MKTHTGEIIKVEGSVIVAIKTSTTSNNEAVLLPLLNVPGNGPNLMGKNWMKPLNWAGIAYVQ